MAISDLTKPLGRGKELLGNTWLHSTSIATALSCLLIIFLIGWIFIVEDPLGGEPVTVVRLDKSPERVDSQDIGVLKFRTNSDETPKVIDNLVRENDSQQRATLEPLFPPRDEFQPGDNFNQNQSPNFDASDIVIHDPNLPDIQKLSSRPHDELSEVTHDGILPKIAKDGTQPMKAYARSSDRILVGDNIPQIAIIVGGMGLSQRTTQEAIRVLPGEITFGFAPYGTSLKRWVSQARESGHELVLQIPLEPYDFPNNDPGPHTLLTSLNSYENTTRLHWLMSRLTNYIGVMTYMGGRFTTDKNALSIVLEEMGSRGLLFIDEGSAARSQSIKVAKALGVASAKADVIIDINNDPVEIDSRLIRLEEIARKRGKAIGTASALPLSIKRLEQWAKDAKSRGIEIIPLSYAVLGKK